MKFRAVEVTGGENLLPCFLEVLAILNGSGGGRDRYHVAVVGVLDLHQGIDHQLLCDDESKTKTCQTVRFAESPCHHKSVTTLDEWDGVVVREVGISLVRDDQTRSIFRQFEHVAWWNHGPGGGIGVRDKGEFGTSCEIQRESALIVPGNSAKQAPLDFGKNTIKSVTGIGGNDQFPLTRKPGSRS